MDTQHVGKFIVGFEGELIEIETLELRIAPDQSSAGFLE